MTVRYCPICDIAECATHRPVAASQPMNETTTAALKAIAKGPQMGEVMETWIYYAMATAQEALDKAKQKDNTNGIP